VTTVLDSLRHASIPTAIICLRTCRRNSNAVTTLRGATLWRAGVGHGPVWHTIKRLKGIFGIR